jgi:hypothetical protein
MPEAAAHGVQGKMSQGGARPEFVNPQMRIFPIEAELHPTSDIYCASISRN